MMYKISHDLDGTPFDDLFSYHHRAIADDPVGQVLAGSLFLKVKNSILQKASNKQKY